MKISDGMKSIMKVALFIGAVALVGTCILNCLPEERPRFHKELNNTDQVDMLVANWDTIMVVRDEKRHVTCYVTSGTGGGISCIPDQFNKLP